MKALIRTTILSGVAALALLASIPASAEVKFTNPYTQQTAAMSNQDFASEYSRTLADKGTTRDISGNLSCGGYNAKISSCRQLTAMEAWQRMGGNGDTGRGVSVNSAGTSN